MRLGPFDRCRMGRGLLLLIGLLLACPPPSVLADSGSDQTVYPRDFQSTGGTVTVEQPVVEGWEELRTLQGRIPLTIRSIEGENWSGEVAFDVDTRINLDERLVRLEHLQLRSFDFDRGPLPPPLQELVAEALEAGTDQVSLDTVLRALPPDFKIPGSGDPAPRLNFAPPRIVVSERPMRLLLIDGQPALEPIESSELEYVINTDWDIFHDKGTDRWYLLDNGHWLTNTLLASGDWLSTVKLPAALENLQFNSYWPQVANALPPGPPNTPPLPFTISYEPTELVVIDGEPQLELIPGTTLRYVNNTPSDLFVLADRYYLLVSGRWFMTKNLKRMWSAVQQLPPAFASIPPDHEKAYVRASVPGTEEARLAMIEAAIPRYAIIDLDAGKGIAIPYAGAPSFVTIEGTVLQRAENTPFQVILHNNFYYLCHEGAWFSSTQPAGPWQVATEVPEAIYTIPPTDPAYNVTFVRLETFDDSSGRVAYSQTSGYRRVYSNGYSMVYGTGWYYPGHIQDNPFGYRTYWRYPYSYGYGARYNPYFGRYGFGGYGGYYPYGYNQSATFTLDKPEKDWKWDLQGNQRRIYEYAPQNYIGSGQYILPDGSVYGGEQKKQKPDP